MRYFNNIQVIAKRFSLFMAAQEAPDRIALLVDGVPYSFENLSAKVLQTIHTILALSLQADAKVAVLGTNRLKTFCLIYALIELRIPMVLIHPRLTFAERKQLLDDSDASYFFDENWEISSEEPSPFNSEPMDEEHILAILYTSGTSGHPKGAMLSARALHHSTQASESNLSWQADDRWLLCLSVAHMGGFSILLRCLAARRTVVINEPESGSTVSPFDPQKVVQVIERDQVTLVSLVPTMLKKILDAVPAWSSPSRLRAILLGGAAASATLIDQAIHRNLPLLTTYGLTEACSQVTIEQYGSDNANHQGVGFPVDGMEVRVHEHEIQIRGPCLFSGYLSQKKYLLPTLNQGWFNTGDLGYFDAQGQLHILNRRTDLIVSGGENIYPSEIERYLEMYPGIKAACVFGVFDETWGQIVAMALIADENLQVPSLLTMLRNQLASYKIPRRIAFLSSFPMNDSGKLNRAEVAKKAIPLLKEWLT